MSGCPAEGTLAQFVEGLLDPTDAQALRAHIDHCPACLQLLAALGVTSTASPADNLSLTGSAGFTPPRRIDEYRVLHLLGEGAMGQVYSALDTRLDRHVAIKFIAAPEPDAAARERFLLEARAIARLSHPNVVGIYRIGEVQGRPYLVSELVKGQDLDSLAKPMPWRSALRVALDLVRGLAAAHHKGVLHRDIKPANVILTEDGLAKLLDFGLAKLTDDLSRSVRPEHQRAPGPVAASPQLTAAGSLLGTPRYMAPEIWRGEPATVRTDLYSLGALLYELCSGDPPHRQQTMKALSQAVRGEDARPLRETAPAVDRRLAAAIDRCLRRDPLERYESAQELGEVLERLADEVRPKTPAPRLRWRQGARRWAAVMGAALVTIVGLGTMLQRSTLRVQAPITSSAKTRRSVAVLGFKNLSAHAEVAWLSSALSEMMGGELAADEVLRLVPGESVTRMKIELGLAESDGYARDTLERIRRNLGSDLVVLGSYLALGDGDHGPLRVGIKVQDAGSGDVIAAVSETEEQKNFFELVARAGAALRAKLGLPVLSGTADGGLAAARPATAEAERAYAEGLEKLRRFDSMSATTLLERAVAADPKFAHAHAALADAWTSLGYLDRAQSEARLAFDNSTGLPRVDRLLMEARYRKADKQAPKAVEIYRSLLTLFPDELEYGLGLVRAQVAADQPQAALASAKDLSRLPAPVNEDPRIDYEAANAAYLFSDLKTSQFYAGRAATKGKARVSPLLVAKARRLESYLAFNFGDLADALAHGEEARLLFAEAGDRSGEADALEAIGAIHMWLGAGEQGLREYEEALKLYLQVGNRSEAAVQAANVGNLQCQLGRLAEARSHAKTGVSLGEELSRREAIGASLVVMGWADRESGRLAESRRSLERSLTVLSDLGDQVLIAWARWQIGELLLREGDLAQARTIHEEALAVRRKLGLTIYASESLVSLAVIAMEEHRLADAERMARQALAEFQRRKSASNEVLAEAVLGAALLAQGKAAAAREAIDRVVARSETIEHVLVKLAVAPIAARVHAAGAKAEDLAAVMRQLEDALVVARRDGIVVAELEIRLALGEIEKAGGRRPAGAERLRSVAQDATRLGFGLVARKATALAMR